MQPHQPSPSTVEEIVSQLATLAAKGQSFEFFIPEYLTLGGQAVPETVAKAVIVAKALSMGYKADGFAAAEGGRVFTFRART